MAMTFSNMPDVQLNRRPYRCALLLFNLREGGHSISCLFPCTFIVVYSLYMLLLRMKPLLSLASPNAKFEPQDEQCTAGRANN
ncbi:Uncharacterized protein APZ42_015207 [Daphnia magna]|uniref:Uncharacterized protein n=1 Tax=Daphnia magna TaxID=35525 RepID=A0A162P9V4_9CRUS|nr:Uncharacterized protein APZ42_015207 [Daphnia magna]